MTSGKIENILDGMGIPVNTWISLESVPIVFLKQVKWFMIQDKKTKRIRFNTTDNLVEVIYGIEKEDGFYSKGELITPSSSPMEFYDMDLISGFITSTAFSMGGTFRRSN